MFATSIENSYPTIDHGRRRIDEMAKCRHYENWRKDFDLVDEMESISFAMDRRSKPLGWSPAAMTGGSRTRHSASSSAATFVPIPDPCHFGVPDWLGNFWNPDFARVFPDYAPAYAERFP